MTATSSNAETTTWLGDWDPDCESPEPAPAFDPTDWKQEWDRAESEYWRQELQWDHIA